MLLILFIVGAPIVFFFALCVYIWRLATGRARRFEIRRR